MIRKAKTHLLKRKKKLKLQDSKKKQDWQKKQGLPKSKRILTEKENSKDLEVLSLISMLKMSIEELSTMIGWFQFIIGHLTELMQN